MGLVQVVILLVLLGLNCFFPGYFVLRRLRCSATEIICGSIGLSLILIYLIATAIYWIGIDWRACWLLTGVTCVLAGISWADARRFFGRAMVWQQMRAFGGLLLLSMLLLGLVEHYSGGAWAGDWIEHYQRMEFFLKRLPYETTFLNLYIIPSRPPMMHLIEAYFLGHLGSGFYLFQVATTFLNVLVFFSCVLIAGQMSLFGPRRVWLIAALLATSPLFLHNVTWAWNKQLTAFFVLLSMGLYLRALRMNSALRMVAAAASMAAGIVVHYSAVPYAIFLFLHYIWNFIWRRRSIAEVLASAGVTVALLLSWFSWSIAVYGLHATLASNTAVAEARHRDSSQWVPIAQNVYYTVVPHFFRQNLDRFDIDFAQPNPYGFVRDWFFNLYQPNLLFAFGLVGWIAVSALAIRLIRRGDRPLSRFWVQFLILVIPLGIAVHGSVEKYGVAHVCLQPVVILGLTLLAVGWSSLWRASRMALVGVLIVDVWLGIVLHFRIEMLDVNAVGRNGVAIIPMAPGLPNPQAAVNSAYRFANDMAYLAAPLGWIQWLVLLLAILLLAVVIYGITNAAIAGKWRWERRLAPLPTVACALFLGGAMLCITDRVAGYTLRHTLNSPVVPNPAQFTAAIAPYIPGVEAQEESTDLYYNVALVAYEYGQLQIALDAAKNAMILDPQDNRARYMFYVIRILNKVLLPTGDPLDLALQRKHMDSVTNVLNYGDCLVENGFKKKAIQVFAEGVAKFPDSAILRERHATLLKQATSRPAE